MTLAGGDEGRTAYIVWFNHAGEFVGQILAGSINGLVLSTRNSDAQGWTEICINEEQILLCPEEDQ